MGVAIALAAGCSSSNTASDGAAAPSTTPTSGSTAVGTGSADASDTDASTAPSVLPPSSSSPSPSSSSSGTTDPGAGSTSYEALIVDAVGDQPGGAEMLRRVDGQVDDVTAGVADSSGTTLKPGQPFRIASNTKPFVATMVLQLVDEGAVDLDAPLNTYLPDAALGGSATVRQLLSHRSGLPDYGPALFQELPDDGDLTRWYTPAEVLALAAKEPALEPGEFAYSNTNYVLLGQLIETLDKRPLNESLEVRISQPLELTNTVLPTEADPNAGQPIAAWYPGLLDGEAGAPYDSFESAFWAAGGIVSTSTDLLTFLDALFGGQLLKADSLAEMVDLQPAVDMPGSTGYGLGIMGVADAFGTTALGHGGGLPGYNSQMFLAPDSGDALIVFTTNPEIDLTPVLERAVQK